MGTITTTDGTVVDLGLRRHPLGGAQPEAPIGHAPHPQLTQRLLEADVFTGLVDLLEGDALHDLRRRRVVAGVAEALQAREPGRAARASDRARRAP